MQKVIFKAFSETPLSMEYNKCICYIAWTAVYCARAVIILGLIPTSSSIKSIWYQTSITLKPRS